MGGWIVLHLIARGEDPRRIRIFDIRHPIRQDLLEGLAAQVDFCQVDISDAAAVEEAFRKPWAKMDDVPEPELTVFHTAAIIRFYERDESLQHLSDKVNLAGTQNVVAAARNAGASAFVYTSSGSVSVRSTRFFRWPWEGPPEFFTQPVSDDDAQVPKRHEHFFSNYAHSKWKAERFVRAADRSPSGSSNGVMRTGCIRPGNGIYGPGGDLMLDPYIHRKSNPSWIFNILQSFIYVENCSVAHLAYEQRLIELAQGTPNPDIGGQAFCVADAGPPVTYGEVYSAITELTRGAVTFIHFSATAMLTFATLVETYYLGRHALLRAPAPLSVFARLMPALNGDIVFLQPSMWSLTQVHLIFDDSRARASLAEGGLGYNGHVTTMQGICKGVAENQKNAGKGQQRVIAGHPTLTSDLGFGLTKAEKGVEDVIEKLGGGHKVDTKPKVAELQY